MALMSCSKTTAVGLLFSGGLDSSILLGHLLEQGHPVQPLYVRCGLAWQTEELRAAERFLRAIASPKAADLVLLDLPVADLYDDHWSVSGRNVPDADSPATAVYLPGRNALLTIKPALWCALHRIDRLALAILTSNPFGDATPEFFAQLESALERATGTGVCLLRPFGRLGKRDVMQLGRHLPLELTFSCIAPVHGLHCGRCNKCAERKAAFRAIGMDDPTEYAGDRVTLHGK